MVCALIAGVCAVDVLAGMLGTLAGAGTLVAEATQEIPADGQAGEDAIPPSWFEEELFSLEGREGVCVADDGIVVGFEMEGDAAQSLDELARTLEEKGWTMAESGMEGNAAFVKKDGMCRWAWVSCIDVAGTTSVVVQCAAEAV